MECCILKEVLTLLFSHFFDVFRFVFLMQFSEPEFLVLDELIESLINDNVILLKFLLYKVHIAHFGRLTRNIHIKVAVREISIVVKFLIFFAFLRIKPFNLRIDSFVILEVTDLVLLILPIYICLEDFVKLLLVHKWLDLLLDCYSFLAQRLRGKSSFILLIKHGDNISYLFFIVRYHHWMTTHGTFLFCVFNSEKSPVLLDLFKVQLWLIFNNTAIE